MAARSGSRIDHYQSEAHRFSWRFPYDSHDSPMIPTVVAFPVLFEQNSATIKFPFSDSYTFWPSYTNEFRFSYARPDSRGFVPWPGRSHWR